MSLLISVNCPKTQWQLCPMPTLLYRQEPHQWELLRIEVATAAVPSARWTYYDHNEVPTDQRRQQLAFWLESTLSTLLGVGWFIIFRPSRKRHSNLYNVFVPSCDTWNFRFRMLSDLAGIFFNDQHGRYFLGLFSLLCSFSVVVLMQWLNTLDVVWVLGGPRTS